MNYTLRQIFTFIYTFCKKVLRWSVQEYLLWAGILGPIVISYVLLGSDSRRCFWKAFDEFETITQVSFLATLILARVLRR